MGFFGGLFLGYGTYKSSKAAGSGFAYFIMFLLIFIFFFTIPLGLIIQNANKYEKINNFFRKIKSISIISLYISISIVILLMFNRSHLPQEVVSYTIIGFSISSILFGLFYLIKKYNILKEKN